jgi:hypothetical protein
LIEGQLYKKGISQPMLKCITETEGIEILREVHNGTYGSHSGPRALAAKVIRQGFYWPAIICTASRVTRSCKVCQKFSPSSGNPSQFMKRPNPLGLKCDTITSPRRLVNTFIHQMITDLLKRYKPIKVANNFKSWSTTRDISSEWG